MNVNAKNKQVALIVLDGWGERESEQDNAIKRARTPFFDSLRETYANSLLDASGESVGLPAGQIGNSEVGHMAIGTGTNTPTGLVRITADATSGGFSDVAAFNSVFDHVSQNDSTLHFVGLVSPGGVHSHSDHLYALVTAAAEKGLKKILIHVFTDGRDVPPQSASTYLTDLESTLKELGVGRIASVSGRFYGMDRDGNWERTREVERALFQGVGLGGNYSATPSAVVQRLYETENAMDEHLKPLIFLNSEKKADRISENDGVIIFNFRADRVRMITEKMCERKSDMNLSIATMTEYKPNYDVLVAYGPVQVETTLAEQIANAGLSQVHIAETVKYPHATYFLNGGVESPHENEEFVLVDTIKGINTHNEAPEMRAREITDEAIKWSDKDVDFIFINYANADMVGHTGDVDATIMAVETIDRELERVVTHIMARGGLVFVTADHGNAELNIDQDTQQIHTAHTTNKVPAILTDKDVTLRDGELSDVAPTLLELMNIKVPSSMTGASLIQK